jgi:branched-chain amino acid transport system substrate-binding protein
MIQQTAVQAPAGPDGHRSPTAAAPAPTPYELAMREVEAVNREAGDNPIKIGVLSPMSRPGDAMAGILVTRGARLAADYLRERGGVLGGRNIALVAYNDMATAAEEGFHRSAVAGLAKLAMVDEVLAVLGQWHLRTTPWVAELCEKVGLPMFVENGDSTATHRRRTIFRTYFSIADRVPLMMDCLAQIGVRRIGMIAPDTVFGRTIADSLQEYGRSRHGMEFLRCDFAQEEALDWRDDLRRIADWRPDAFINGGLNVIAGGGPVGNSYAILQQAIEVGLLPGVALMVTFGFPMRSQDYWRMAGPSGNGVMWPATRFRPSWPGMTEIGRWFTDRFIERYGFAPPDTCLSAFTDITIIGQALEMAGTDTREGLLDALESGEFDTWRGPLRFERGEQHWHHSPPELIIMQYQKVGQSFDEAAVIFPEDRSDAPYAGPDDLG